MADFSPVSLAGASPLASMPQSPLLSAMPQVQAPKRKVNWLGVLADALAGATGRQGPYATMLMQQRQAEQEEQQYQRHRNDQFDMWRQQQEYETAHPKPEAPSGYARELLDMGLTPGTPEYQSRIDAHLKAVDDPVVTITLPGNRVYSGPRSGLAAALSGGANPDATPTVEDGYSYTPGPGGRANQANWKKAGGPTPRASGGFR